MKNRLMSALLALVAVCSIGFVSCKKETVIQGNADSGSYRVYINIAPNQWQYNSSTGEYYKDVDANGLLPQEFTYTIDGVLMFAGPSDANGVKGITYPVNGNATLINGFYYYFDTDADQIIRIYAKPVSGNAAPTSYMFFNIVFVQPKDLGPLSTINKNDHSAVKKFLGLKD